MNEKETIKISKLLSLVLRHQPEFIGISLDEQGWTDVSIVIDKITSSGVNIDIEMLRHVVDTNQKRRFNFSDDGTRIRASQGHSVDVELGYAQKIPPEILYHGTARQNVESILTQGLQKRERHHVHLSADVETAINVGQRHGKPVVLEVAAGKMHNAGHKFFLTDNRVWLTDDVPPGYLSILP